MDTINMATLIYGTGYKPGTPFESRQKHDEILANLNAPIHLGAAQKVSHDTKTDRYVATFTPAQGKSLTLRVTNEVAAFIAQRVAEAGYWQGRMEAGALTDVYLIQSV